MSASKLKYVSTKVFDTLRADVEKNLERYLRVGFEDLSHGEDWSMKLSIECDLSRLRTIQDTDDLDIEVKNSLIVWECLSTLSPALANEGRLWTRLTHVECFEYSRARWI